MGAMSAKDEKISLTQAAYQLLIKKRDLLEKERDEGKKGWFDINRDEKEPNGNTARAEAERQAYIVQGRIDELNDQLGNSVIVSEDSGPILTVSVGNKVVLHLHRDGEDERLEAVIDGVCDVCGSGTCIIMPDSPIGKAVIGAKVGDERQCCAPNGTTFQIVVVSVSH